MSYHIIRRFLIISLFLPSFLVMAGSWTEVDLNGESEFNNECEYRIKSKAYGNGQSVLKSNEVHPTVIRFYIGGVHNPGYIEASEKQKLCTDALEAASYVDINGNPCNSLSESCHQKCIILDSVISIEELCQ